MTTVQISLPDKLAQEAKQAGLLSPDLLERLLREELKVQRRNALTMAMDRMSAVDEPAALSAEELEAEIRILRADRKNSNKS